jgi:hypothetical protein
VPCDPQGLEHYNAFINKKMRDVGRSPIVVAQAVMLAALAVLPLLDDAPVSGRGRPVVEGSSPSLHMSFSCDIGSKRVGLEQGSAGGGATDAGAGR